MKCRGCGEDKHPELFVKHHITDTKTVNLCVGCHRMLTVVIEKIYGDKEWWSGKSLEDLAEAGDEVRNHPLYEELSANLQDILLRTWPRASRRHGEPMREYLRSK